MSAFSARILNICRVVTSVQRPCLMMSVTHLIELSFEVNGAAMLASPSLTICAFSSSWIWSSIRCSSFMRAWAVGARRLRPRCCRGPGTFGFALNAGEFVISFRPGRRLPSSGCGWPGRLPGVGRFGAVSGAFAISAMPVCACFRAPTSFVPSPKEKKNVWLTLGGESSNLEIRKEIRRNSNFE